MRWRTSRAVAPPALIRMLAWRSRHQGPADARALEAAPVRQPPAPTPSIFLKMEPGRGLSVQRRVPGAAPLQVGVDDLAEPVRRRRAPAGTWPRGPSALGDVERRVVVAEVEPVAVHGAARAVGVEQVGRLDDLIDEHRPLALGRRRQKVQVLPQRPADRGRDAGVVLERRSDPPRGSPDQVGPDDGPALGRHAVVVDGDVRRAVADHDAAEAAVADQDVGAQP